MPYYHWKGVRIDASYCKGSSFARNPEELKNLLFTMQIALLTCSVKKYIHLLPISSEQAYHFFRHLHALIDAGVHIRQALLIMCNQTADPRCADITLQVAERVGSGLALHEALTGFQLFSPEMIHITQIGSEAGNLPVALHMLCAHLDDMQLFKKQLRGILWLPICTFFIFMLILLAVLLIIIPRYAHFFASLGKEIPLMTSVLLKISSFVASYYMLGAIFITITCVTVLITVLKKPSIKRVVDKKILHMPYIGSLLKQIAVVQVLRSLALLLRGGMSLVPALSIAREAVSNTYIEAVVQDIIEQVRTGHDLSYAMQRHPDIFYQDIVLLVTVGQETGYLQEMITRAATLYTQKVQQNLQRFIFILQPTLMIILGLLVALLICSVYLPLFNLADLTQN